MDEMLLTAAEAARSAGDVIIKAARRLSDVSYASKGRNDFVSETDTQAEQEIIRILRSTYPSHSILAEESGALSGDGYEWIIDPLDGTTNFLHSYPCYGVSIALTRDGALEKAVVYDPTRPELFTAARDHGSSLYGMKLQVSGRTRLEDSLLGTGFPFKCQEHLPPYMKTFEALLTRSRGVRRAGAASLDLASVAAGRLDGFWEIGLEPWDMAAGALLVREAGGFVSDFAGGEDFLSEDFLSTGNIVAGTPAVWEQILETIKPLLPGTLAR
ncbi:MAG: inositol monophosphatase [Deltaproteobacteria bacterium]|nr:inositol monophosphatase [Deltaproteobacteria bacterium]